MTDLFVFIDESGDLGFKSKSTPYFIVACVLVDSNNIHRIDKEIKRLHKKIHKGTKYRFNEFKYVENKPDIRIRLIELIPKLPIQIGSIYIKDKNKIKKELRDKAIILYNYITIHYPLYNILLHYNNVKRLYLILDSNKTKRQENDAKDYFNRKINYLAQHFGLTELDATIDYKHSHTETGLQLADYIAGILKDKYVYNKDDYYNYIKEKIVFEIIW